ncbi:MAG: DeoR family transcriptional regulator [Candidatus Marinimicrobia bacterium]|nr:DeoR family transcriptional regulator [Candidatus Neomarinimicrobiota bacterium]
MNEIVKLITKDNKITIYTLSQKLNVSDKTIKRDIVKLKSDNILKREGSLKAGHWVVLK